MGKHLQSLLSAKHCLPCSRYVSLIEAERNDCKYIIKTNTHIYWNNSFIKNWGNYMTNIFEGSMITKYSWIFEKDTHIRNDISDGPLTDLLRCCIFLIIEDVCFFHICAQWLLIRSRQVILQIIMSLTVSVCGWSWNHPINTWCSGKIAHFKTGS